MGEDVGKLGGVFRVTDGLQKDFGEDRVIDTPLAESGIIGTAVGLAMRGYRPVCEIQFDGFVFPGFDQIVSQVAKMHNRSAARCGCRSRSASPSAAASARSSTTASRRRPTSRTPPGLEGRRLLEPVGRLLDDPAGDRQRRPDRLLRAEAPLLGQGRGRRDADPAAPGAGRAARPRRHPARVRADGGDGARVGRGRRRGRPGARGHRPALALAARHADRHRVGRAQDRPADRRARGAAQLRRRAPRSPPASRSRRSTRSRRRCCGSPASTRPTRRAGSRTSGCRTSTASSTPSTRAWGTDVADIKAVQAARPRRGADRRRHPEVDGRRRRHRRGERHDLRGRDGEGGRRAAVAVRRRRHRIARRRGETVDVGTPIISIDVAPGAGAGCAPAGAHPHGAAGAPSPCGRQLQRGHGADSSCRRPVPRSRRAKRSR